MGRTKGGTMQVPERAPVGHYATVVVLVDDVDKQHDAVQLVTYVDAEYRDGDDLILSAMDVVEKEAVNAGDEVEVLGAYVVSRWEVTV